MTRRACLKLVVVVVLATGGALELVVVATRLVVVLLESVPEQAPISAMTATVAATVRNCTDSSWLAENREFGACGRQTVPL
jgi:hypothetical protein